MRKDQPADAGGAQTPAESGSREPVGQAQNGPGAALPDEAAGSTPQSAAPVPSAAAPLQSRLPTLLARAGSWLMLKGHAAALRLGNTARRTDEALVRAAASGIHRTVGAAAAVRSAVGGVWTRARGWHPLTQNVVGGLLVSAVLAVLGFAFNLIPVPSALWVGPFALPTATAAPVPSTAAPPGGTRAPSTPARTAVQVRFSSPVTIALGVVGGYGKQHSIVRDLRGTLWAFFGLGDGRQLVYATSSNQGRTWSLPAPLGTPGGDFQEPAATLDAAGLIHLVFGGWRAEGAYYTRGGSQGWTDPVFVGRGAFGRNIAVDSANRPWVVWSGAHLWMNRFDGTSWRGEEVAQSNGWHPEIAIDGGDHVHLGFNYGGPYPRPDVRAYLAEYNGQAWSERRALTDDPFWSGAVSFAFDARGVLHIVFLSSQTREGGNDLVYYVPFVGGRWGPLTAIGSLRTSGGETGKEAPCIAVDGNGVVYVAWRGLNDVGKKAIYVSAFTSGWTDAREIPNPDASEVGWPSIVANRRQGAGVELIWDAVVGIQKVVQHTHLQAP